MKLTDIFNRIIQHKFVPFFYLGIFILLLVISYFIYQKYTKKKIDTPDISNANRRFQTIDVHFFHTKWCPWCKKTMPIWEDFVRSYNGNVIGQYTVNCIGGTDGTDCTNEENPEIADTLTRMKIKKFPTVKFIYNNTVVDFEAKITKENLYSCIQEIA